MTYYSRTKGFTLIELLVVISIIGMLTATIVISVSQVRRKGVVTVLKQEMYEFRKLLELNYDPSVRAADGKVWGYSGLFSHALNGDGQNTTWLTTIASCDMSYGAGSFAAGWNASAAAEANKICKKIVSTINPTDQLVPVIGGVTYSNPFVLRVGNGADNRVHVGPPPTGYGGSYDWGAGDRYSIQLYTDGNMVAEEDDIYCLGSSGVAFGLNDNPDQSVPGCYMNP